jgi:hypothetical protein
MRTVLVLNSSPDSVL